VVLALVLAAGIALAWRAHAVAQRTHDILQQILENQTKAQAAKGGKRRAFTSRHASATESAGALGRVKAPPYRTGSSGLDSPRALPLYRFCRCRGGGI
jgi:hypothetical protein